MFFDSLLDGGQDFVFVLSHPFDLFLQVLLLDHGGVKLSRSSSVFKVNLVHSLGTFVPMVRNIFNTVLVVLDALVMIRVVF